MKFPRKPARRQTAWEQLDERLAKAGRNSSMADIQRLRERLFGAAARPEHLIPLGESGEP